MNLNNYEGKKIKIILPDNREFEAIGIDYMLGDDYDEEYNSLSLRVTKVIVNGKDAKHNLQPYMGGKMLYAIYENENVKIEEI